VIGNWGVQLRNVGDMRGPLPEPGLLPDRAPSFLVRVRRPATIVVALCALVLVTLGLRYTGETSGRWLDHAAQTLIRSWLPVRRGAARAVIDLFDPLPMAVLIGLLAGACLLLRRRRLALLAVAGPVLTGVATTVLKELFGRTKDGDLAYPSGHGGAATALALVAALLLVSVLTVRLWVGVAIVAGVTVAAGGVMAVLMTMANYHYLTDAIGGFCVAVSVVLGLALLIDPPRRRSRHSNE
jgi:membrane-associated phospholipid phosphatase